VRALESVSAGQRPAGCPAEMPCSGTVRSVREKAVRDTFRTMGDRTPPTSAAVAAQSSAWFTDRRGARADGRATDVPGHTQG